MTETALTAAPATTDALAVRACVLREPGRPRRSRASGWTRRGRARSSCASPLRASATPTCTSPTAQLGEGRWPVVLGHEGAGVVTALGAGVTGVDEGDHVVFCLVASCGVCEACRSGRRTLCEPAGAAGVAGNLRTGTRRLRAGDGSPLQHGSPSPALPSTPSLPAAAYPHPRATFRCGRRRCWAVGSSPVSAPSPMPPGCGSASASRHRLRRSGTAGDRRRPAGRRGHDRRRRPSRREARARPAPRSHPWCRRLGTRCRRRDPPAHRWRRRPCVRGRRRCPDDPPGLGRAAPGRHRRRRRPRPTSAWRSSLPAIEFLSEKSIVGSYYGTGGPGRRRCPASSSSCTPGGWSWTTWSRTSSTSRACPTRWTACAAARATVPSSSSTPSLAGATAAEGDRP